MESHSQTDHHPLHQNEIFKFLLVGGCAVLIDGVIYFLLSDVFQITSPENAKRYSFIAGAIWAYGMNKYFTFKKPEASLGEPILFCLIYLVGWIANGWVHDLIYPKTPFPIIAFIAATAVSTINNFIGQKWIVFRKNKAKHA